MLGWDRLKEKQRDSLGTNGECCSRTEDNHRQR